MTRPDWCDEKTWAEAKKAAGSPFILTILAEARLDRLVERIARALLSAKEEARKEERERLAVWLESQRKDIPAHGWEFAAAIRNGDAS